MSIHINAQPEDISKIVLLAGDPLRAKFIAENFLSNYKMVNHTRNAFYFTGYYKDKLVTVGASGMGCASIGIYSYELFADYKVDCIIRIGTCGAYTTELKLFDMINVVAAASESTFAKYAWGIEENVIPYQGKAFDIISETAKEINIPLLSCNIHSSDIFYRKDFNIPQVAVKNNCLAVEMEAFALFANAKYLNKTAATLLTVSDVIPTYEKLSSDQREISLLQMMNVALEATLKIQ